MSGRSTVYIETTVQDACEQEPMGSGAKALFVSEMRCGLYIKLTFSWFAENSSKSKIYITCIA